VVAPNAGGVAAARPEAAAAGRVELKTRLTWRSAFAFLWPPAIVAVIYGSVGRLGFFPTDEGLVLAYSYRILNGEVPHRDFISPRPLGSALLHLVDFAIPGPLFEVSRVIALGEFVAYSVLFAWLVYEVAPGRWSLAMTAGGAASVLVNLNRFPLMAWYTVDGLLLVAAGLLVVRTGVSRGSWRVIVAGFVLLGLAALTKQSFVPATAIGWLILWPRLRTESWGQRVRDLVVTGAYGAAPFILFVAAISALGGFTQMRHQLLGSALVYGASLVNPWLTGRDIIALTFLTATTALLSALAATTRANSPESMAGLARAILLTAVVVGASLSEQLGLRGDDWGTRLFWMAVAFCIVESVIRRSVDVVGVALIGTAWMSALSYSFFVPDLVAGSLGIYMVHRTWTGTRWPKVLGPRLGPAIASIALFAVTSYVFGVNRVQDVYLDRQGYQLTANLSGVSPTFGDISTNPETAQYLAQMKQCVRRFPARNVAILPENAAMYPALSLRNPFPIDWIWPYDVHGSESRILGTTDQLNRDGDYLVMFQTVDEPQIVNGDSLPPASAGSPIQAFTPIAAEIYARLNGVKTTCGTFLVVYEPPAAE